MDRYVPGAVPELLHLTEAAYLEAERAGKALNDVLCDDCPDPGLCAAEGACGREGFDAPDLWDRVS